MVDTAPDAGQALRQLEPLERISVVPDLCDVLTTHLGVRSIGSSTQDPVKRSACIIEACKITCLNKATVSEHDAHEISLFRQRNERWIVSRDSERVMESVCWALQLLDRQPGVLD